MEQVAVIGRQICKMITLHSGYNNNIIYIKNKASYIWALNCVAPSKLKEMQCINKLVAATVWSMESVQYIYYRLQVK